jgi:excinuclease UvrABC nuclease subunit
MPISSNPGTLFPKEPGIYAMYGGLSPRTWVAYVGQAGNVAQRLAQHLDRRSSSVATGTSAVGLNVDYVAYVA